MVQLEQKFDDTKAKYFHFLKMILARRRARWLPVALSVPKLLLTHDEKDGADQHSSRKHVFRADMLRRFAHGAQLVRQRVGPEVGQKQSAAEEGQRAVPGTAGHLHFGTADGLNIELQDHHREDNHPKRQDEGRPGFHFTLGNSTGNRC